MPKTAKFTQENRNGNRLGREITPTKHGTLCLPEILEHEAVRTPTFWNELEMTAQHHATVSRSWLCLPETLPPTAPVVVPLLVSEQSMEQRGWVLISSEVVRSSHVSQQVAQVYESVWMWRTTYFRSVQEYATKSTLELRTALLWVVTQVVAIPYRCCRTTYQSYLLEFFLNPWKWDRLIVPNRRYGITTPRCIITQKNAVFIYFAEEIWNHECWTFTDA